METKVDLLSKAFTDMVHAAVFLSTNSDYPLIVTVEDPPITFSPFSLADCTMLSHFSFNDFIAIAFLDLARDLDVQI